MLESLRTSWTLRLLFSPVVIASIGLASIGLANLRGMSTPAFVGALFSQQLFFTILAATVAALVAMVDMGRVQRHGYHLFLVGLVLLASVLVFGESIHGARRWLDFGVVYMQPSELIKLLVIVAFAKYVGNNSRGDEPKTLRWVLIPAAIAAVPIGLILLQPDLSSAMIVVFIFFILIVVAGLRATSIAKLIALVLVVLPPVWFFVLKSYQRSRLVAFLEPGDDPLGTDWQTSQSVIAIGSGGWTGQGWSESTQITFVPCHHDDLPFSIFCEEQGLLGALVVLGLYLVLCLWCLRIARAAHDRYGAIVSTGVGLMIFLQVMINLGVTLGVMPSTGVALPFFSTGGSALFTTMLGLGMVLGISLEASGLEHPRWFRVPSKL